MINVYKDIYQKVKNLVEIWKYRQTCDNQSELNDISKAKAHIYGICAEELLEVLKYNLPDNKAVPLDKYDKCEFCGGILINGRCINEYGY